jgi:hypothetical protein
MNFTRQALYELFCVGKTDLWSRNEAVAVAYYGAHAGFSGDLPIIYPIHRKKPGRRATRSAMSALFKAVFKEDLKSCLLGPELSSWTEDRPLPQFPHRLIPLSFV